MIDIESVTGGLLKNGSSLMGIYIGSEKHTGLCVIFKIAASLQRPTAVHFLMRLSVCTVNTVM